MVLAASGLNGMDVMATADVMIIPLFTPATREDQCMNHQKW